MGRCPCLNALCYVYQNYVSTLWRKATGRTEGIANLRVFHREHRCVVRLDVDLARVHLTAESGTNIILRRIFVNVHEAQERTLPLDVRADVFSREKVSHREFSQLMSGLDICKNRRIFSFW